MSNNPTKTDEWKSLSLLAENIKKKSLNDLFAKDKNRFDNFSIHIDGLCFDYSKQLVSLSIIKKLSDLTNTCGLDQKRQDMFSGKAINVTENRAVLHTALRRPANDVVKVGDQNVIPLIHATLQKMKIFSNNVRAGNYKGATGKPINRVVSIGIGGSDLGPRLVCHSLDDGKDILPVDFVANVDGSDIDTVLQKCNPEQTLFIIISKSFKTQETLVNAQTAQKWLKAALPANADISNHFIAVSANVPAVEEFGIPADNIFPMWDWVNGRFSLWSAVGLSICFQNGFDVFEKLLAGAHAMDQHFQIAAPEKNMPVLMALIGIWNINFLGYDQLAILPYAQKLGPFPFYLQQLEMESNGKCVDLEHNPIMDYKTSPVIFGEVGTNGQHSFYQLLHQGTDNIPCDFIGFIKSTSPYDHQHTLLMNHMLAQGQALMQGKAMPNQPHHAFNGNKPSSTLLIKQLDAYHLGMLIALYEHKCFVQGIIWNINSFDQFGVELGKELSQKIEKNDLANADPSTKALFSLIHKSGK